MAASRTRRFGLGAATVVVGATAVTIPATLGHAASPTPSLRLVSGVKHVEADRFGGSDDLFIPDSVYAAATNGAFEIDVTHSHGATKLEQVERNGDNVKAVRRIKPAGPVKLRKGLPKFFDVTVTDANGKVVSTTHPSFCPTGGFDSQRIDPRSVDNPTYPEGCGDRLTKATIWGIDPGWADGDYFDLKTTPDKAPDGHYTLTIAVAPSYQRQLQIPAADASITTDLKIVTQTGGCGGGVCPGAQQFALRQRSMRAAAQAAAGSQYVSKPDSSGGLPDLVALPAHGLSISHNDKSGKDFLNFGATIWNAGPGTFDVEGFRHDGRPTMQARQYIYRDGKSVRSMKIGRFEFDNRKGHHHWHLEDVARYDLLNANHDRVVLSDKQSFCLAPTDPIKLTVPGALWNPENVGLESSCPTDQSLWLRETLPVGWGDTYVQEKGGQAFNITDVPNGNYLIRIATNPFGNIHEVTRKNNTALLPITLGGTPGARTVTKDAPVSTGPPVTTPGH